MLYLAGVLYLIAKRLKCDVEPLGGAFLADVLAVAVEQGEEAEKLREEYERQRRGF
jgi:hypothetical protein